ncbi:MAG: hypothetical protein K9N29_07195 [Candidatus Marinimicrobia bacterium]|nr:hypothetical protein [Candidatus Neomarinimicrobiota bacterium]
MRARIFRERLSITISMPIIFAFWGNLLAQTPIFSSETITFEVSDTLCVVSARYSFQNRSEMRSKSRLFYPVPISDDLPFPNRFQVQSLKSSSTIPFLIHKEGISFLLEIDPFSEEQIYVKYWQVAKGQQFAYILKSTQHWSRALDWAVYEIRIPNSLELKSCSLDIDSTRVDSNYFIYRITKQNFMPEKDFEFMWGNQK